MTVGVNLGLGVASGLSTMMAMALVLMFFARFAYLRVFTVSYIGRMVRLPLTELTTTLSALH